MKSRWKYWVRRVYKGLDLDPPYSSQIHSAVWDQQRERCFERDDYTCQVCEMPESELEAVLVAHHITSRSKFQGTPRRMDALNNLVSLCQGCHNRYEDLYEDCTVDKFVEKAQMNLF